MATRFGVWIDTPNTGESGNVMSYSAFASDTQRASGFMSGTIASSIRMNTALRQATLVTAALMNAIAPDSTLDMNSSLADLTNFLSTFFSPDHLVRKGYVNLPGAVGHLAMWNVDDLTGELVLASAGKLHVSYNEPTPSDGDVGDIWFVIEA